jgi:hypothetical protein
MLNFMQNLIKKLELGLNKLPGHTEKQKPLNKKRVARIALLLKDFKPYFFNASSHLSALERLEKNVKIKKERKQEITDMMWLIKNDLVTKEDILKYLFSLPTINYSSYEPSLEESKRGMFDNTPVNKKAVDLM